MEHAGYAVHSIRGYIATLYLIEYEHGLLLLDCGSRGDARRVAEYCDRELKRPIQDIKLAVASHYHPDHGGGAYMLRKEYGIPLAAHPGIGDWYCGLGGFIQHKLDAYMAQALAKSMQVPLESLQYPRKIKPDYLLEDGDTLPFFEDWQVLWTPGHTECDITLYHPDSELLYVFDLINCIKGRYHLPLPVLMHTEMEASLDKLASLSARWALAAHGSNEVFALKPDIFQTLRNEVWAISGPLVRSVYNWSCFSTKWRRYRRQMKASGKSVYPEKIIEWGNTVRLPQGKVARRDFG